jgi:hypothetical protein
MLLRLLHRWKVQRYIASMKPHAESWFFSDEESGTNDTVVTRTQRPPRLFGGVVLSEQVGSIVGVGPVERGLMPPDAKRLLADAEDYLEDQLERRRMPFIRGAVIEEGPTNRHSGFIRDISGGGVGLIHAVELPVGRRITIRTNLRNDVEVKVNAEVAWCKSYGAGWYLSGAIFSA